MRGVSLRLLLACTAVGVGCLVWAGVVFGGVGAPGFMVESFASPTHFSGADNTRCVESGGAVCDSFQVSVINVGKTATDGSPVVVSDVLPAGVVVQQVSGEGQPCTMVPVSCVFEGVLQPDQRRTMTVAVTVEPGVSGPLAGNVVSVSGGGALSVVSSPASAPANEVSSTPAGFGVSNFDFFIAGADGRFDSQAGDHPYELTTTVGFNNMFRELPDSVHQLGKTSVEDVKDVVVDLPEGFAGSILAAPQCTLAQLSSADGCPSNTTVGHLSSEPTSVASVDSPIWNLTPEQGVAGEFGYRDNLHSSHVFYSRVVPTATGYVLETINPDVPQVGLNHVVVTFYGDPAERDGSGGAHIPFFTDPTYCGSAGLTARIHLDSWRHPGRFNTDGSPDFSDPAWASGTSVSPPPVGCNMLQFSPEIQAQPTTTVADSPSGLDFELKIPQNEDAGTHATPALKNAVVRFPAGFTLDPSAGDGLQACSEAQIGWTGPTPFAFTPAEPSCPEASKIGSLELSTPLIPGVLTGAMYLAAQNENPFGSVIGLYIVVDDPVTGVLLKIAGRATADPVTGQITATFDENPQLPFSDLKMHFFGGPRAEFATPENCATYTTTSDLTPWSAPDSGPDATPFDSFQITSGCVNGFAPLFTAGSLNLQAGAYTPFVVSFARSDTDQELAGLSATLPAGLEARLTGIPLCPDADANAGTCPEASQLGTVRAGAGPGPNPLFVGGKAYLTGPYKGAPYGLVVVVPAVAGPFNFGLVHVRQALYIDPNTARVTAVSDAFPTILTPTGADHQQIGIPIRLRRVDVSIDRPGFTFNPTSCSKLHADANITSTQGQASSSSVPFQVTNCATLRFDPKFTVQTSGKTSKRNGASLTATLSYPNTRQGTEANIATVKVSLPKALPSRLSTLQKACLAKTFETNPASCPPGSIVGHATVTVPLLPLPLTGPAYFVSHGGEAFPSLTMVLQGNNVTVILTGSTFISKTGITSTTFKTVPDVPFNKFTLTLPQGPGSALAANGDLCTKHLTMPTQFHAQNGAQHNQTTPIHTTNCPQHHTKKHHSRKHHTKH